MTYVERNFQKHTRAGIERYALTKPLNALGNGDGWERGLEEAVAYQYNFTNALATLRLPGGSKILDVACGAGWLSHFMTRMGYEAHGFDISEDFIVLARRRLMEDPQLGISAEVARERFNLLNIEQSPAPSLLNGQFSAVMLESCLHHFYDPLAALSHLAPLLSDTGVMVIIEGENRTGGIRPEYMDVMREFHTLERPYPRALLIEVLQHCGLAHVEFIAPLNVWMSSNDPASRRLSERLDTTSAGMNHCICAKSEAALARIFPFRGRKKWYRGWGKRVKRFARGWTRRPR